MRFFRREEWTPAGTFRVVAMLGILVATATHEQALAIAWAILFHAQGPVER